MIASLGSWSVPVPCIVPLPIVSESSCGRGRCTATVGGRACHITPTGHADHGDVALDVCAFAYAARALGVVLFGACGIHNILATYSRTSDPAWASRGGPSAAVSWLRLCLIIDRWWAIQRSPGVIGLILDGGRPARVPDGVIDELRGREQDGLIRLPEPPKPRSLRRGDRMRITQGPFAGKLAIYQGMSGAARIAVLLALFGGCVTLTLPKDAVVAL